MMKRFLVSAVSLSLFLSVPVATIRAASDMVVPPTPTPVDAPDRFWPANGVFNAKGHVSSWSGFRARNTLRRSLFATEQAADQNAIVFVGDSITDGWNSLREDFADLNVNVANRGIGGDTTPNLLYRLQDDVLSLHPRGLVILIGTNDLGEHTTPKDIAENLKAMLNQIRAQYPTIPIAWCLVMPRKAEDDYPQRIHTLNTLIKKIAKRDSHSAVCDTFTPLALPDGTSKAEDFKPDHLHPNAAGYVVWRTALHPILESWHLGVK